MLVGLEFAGHHGFTFAECLRARGYALVNILPAHTKRAKELEDNSPNKTDAKDAAEICKLVSLGIFVGYPALQPPYLELRLLTTHRHRLTVEETRFKNRLQSLLDLAWPEFLTHFSQVRKPTPRALLARWPLPQDFLAAAPAAVTRLARSVSRGHVSPGQLHVLRESARTSVALAGAAPERRWRSSSCWPAGTCCGRNSRRWTSRSPRSVEQCPAAKALTTIPEVSATCAATIVAELGAPERFTHPRQVLKLAGMNLVERSSGTVQGRRKQSKRGRPLLRRQLFLLGGRWCQPRGLYRGLPGPAGPQWRAPDQGGLRGGPQAGAAPPGRAPVGPAVRPGALGDPAASRRAGGDRIVGDRGEPRVRAGPPSICLEPPASSVSSAHRVAGRPAADRRASMKMWEAPSLNDL